MLRNEAHLSDEDLLLFSDQELPPPQAARVREHIAQCKPCRERLRDLEAASADFAELHEREIRTQSPQPSISRDLLKTGLSEASARAGTTSAGVTTRQLLSACFALVLIVACTWAIRHIGGLQSGPDARRAEAVALPQRTLTPGSARPVLVADLCSNQNFENDPPVSQSLEEAVFKEYGLPASSEKDYELDYLITPALGGVDTIQNLWPQPYSSDWNARVKDQLEDHLHDLVCQGKLQLATAQHDIASDWIAAYKRYFNTDKPEPNSPTSGALVPGREHNLRRPAQAESHNPSSYSAALMVAAWHVPAQTTALRQTGWHRREQ